MPCAQECPADARDVERDSLCFLMAYPALVNNSTTLMRKVYDFFPKANSHTTSANVPKTAWNGPGPHLSANPAPTERCEKNGQWRPRPWGVKAQRDCEMQGLCQGAVSPCPAGQADEGRAARSQLLLARWEDFDLPPIRDGASRPLENNVTAGDAADAEEEANQKRSILGPWLHPIRLRLEV